MFSVPDSSIMKKTGRILIVAELAREYGFKDVGGLFIVLPWSVFIPWRFECEAVFKS